jgi:fatty acid/phospholipid biosynthesis enzyme
MNVREFYVKNYPADDMGADINPNATFDGLVHALSNCQDVYEYLYVYDSIIRERLFEKLSLILNCEYMVVYNQWLSPIKKPLIKK